MSWRRIGIRAVDGLWRRHSRGITKSKDARVIVETTEGRIPYFGILGSLVAGFSRKFRKARHRADLAVLQLAYAYEQATQ